MAGRWTAGWDRTRKRAQAEYDAQRNLRPVDSPPETLLAAIVETAAAVAGVRWVTLGEYRGDDDRVSRLLVGVRLAPGPDADFTTVDALFKAAVREALGARVEVEVVELDADVDETMADGTSNPYVVFRPG